MPKQYTLKYVTIAMISGGKKPFESDVDGKQRRGVRTVGTFSVRLALAIYTIGLQARENIRV